MNTALRTDEDKKEYFDTPEELDKKIDILAQLIKASKHFVVLTGAGISTASGIPDFRSGINTTLPTGPGCWEKAAHGIKFTRGNMSSAIPSMCHMALIALFQAGYLKFLISQNTDGLHRRSGFPVQNIAELHGNSNLEICRNKDCGKQFLRDYRTRAAQDVHDHRTGRHCESCGDELYDSITNFGEDLPEKELMNGIINTEKADLCLALGSSLRVKPAADLPLNTVKNKGKLVIVNLQATPLDSKALRINGMTDEVITKLMAKLDIPIPSFILQRRVVIIKTDSAVSPDNQKKPGIVIRGVDEIGTPYSLFTESRITFKESKESMTKKKEPFSIVPNRSDLSKGLMNLELHFQGHYQEPSLSFDVDLESLQLNEPAYYMMQYDPRVEKWIKCERTELDLDIPLDFNIHTQRNKLLEFIGFFILKIFERIYYSFVRKIFGRKTHTE